MLSTSLTGILSESLYGVATMLDAKYKAATSLTGILSESLYGVATMLDAKYKDPYFFNRYSL
jgi:hypothetical protein